MRPHYKGLVRPYMSIHRTDYHGGGIPLLTVPPAPNMTGAYGSFWLLPKKLEAVNKFEKTVMMTHPAV